MGAGKAGRICPDVGDVLCHGGSGGTSLQVVDVGYIPIHWEDAGHIPLSGGQQTDGSAYKEEAGWDVVLTPTSKGNGGGEHKGGEDIRLPTPEQCRTIYFNKAHYGPVSGSGMYPGCKGVKVVMVSAGIGPVGNADGGSDGGIRIEGEGGRGGGVETDE